MTLTDAAAALLEMAEALKTCQDRCADLTEKLREAERKRDEWAGLYVEAETELLTLRGER